MMLDYLHRLHAHMKWADLRVLAHLRKLAEPRAVRLLSHILAAERVWLTRLQGEDSGRLEIWPEMDLQGCGRLAEEVHAGLDAYLADVTEELLPMPIEYTNQLGVQYRPSRIDVLTQVVIHGGYHRGQIAQTQRLAGQEPINTDYVTWVREGGG